MEVAANVQSTQFKKVEHVNEMWSKIKNNEKVAGK